MDNLRATVMHFVVIFQTIMKKNTVGKKDFLFKSSFVFWQVYTPRPITNYWWKQFGLCKSYNRKRQWKPIDIPVDFVSLSGIRAMRRRHGAESASRHFRNGWCPSRREQLRFAVNQCRRYSIRRSWRQYFDPLRAPWHYTESCSRPTRTIFVPNRRRSVLIASTCVVVVGMNLQSVTGCCAYE